MSRERWWNDIDGRTEVLEFAHHKSHDERPLTNGVNHGIAIMFQFWLKLYDSSSKFTFKILVHLSVHL